MDDSNEGVTIFMETSEDAKTVTITFESTVPMDLHDFIMALESYLTDMIRAYKSVPTDESMKH